MKDDKLYVLHISESIRRIEGYIDGGRDVFLGSTLIQDAVLRNLQTMGESVKLLPSNLPAAYPQAQWREVTGFRNVVVHNYMNLDMERVWQILEEDLPVFKSAVEDMLRSMPDDR